MAKIDDLNSAIRLLDIQILQLNCLLKRIESVHLNLDGDYHILSSKIDFLLEELDLCKKKK